MYDENYKPDTASAIELLYECRSMLDELKRECIKLSAEKEKLIMENIELKTEKEELVTDNLNLKAEIANLSAEIESLKENQWGTPFADS